MANGECFPSNRLLQKRKKESVKIIKEKTKNKTKLTACPTHDHQLVCPGFFRMANMRFTSGRFPANMLLVCECVWVFVFFIFYPKLERIRWTHAGTSTSVSLQSLSVFNAARNANVSGRREQNKNKNKNKNRNLLRFGQASDVSWQAVAKPRLNAAVPPSKRIDAKGSQGRRDV